MTLTYEEATKKIKKLLSLATSSNPNEAALAASRAASIMQDYQISEAALSTVEDEDRAPVESYTFEGGSGKKIHWRMKIASGVAKVCNCSTYWHGPRIMMIGRDLDVKAARYLFDLICPQVEDLAERAWQVGGYGDTRKFMHAFRLGCSITIYSRLLKQAIDKTEEMRTGQAGESPGESSMALMVINSRIAKVDAYMSGLRLKAAGRRPSMSDRGAFNVGREYGKRVSIGGAAKGGLNAPRKQVR